jgi:hypothetical protein
VHVIVTPQVKRPVLFSRSTDENAALYHEQSGSIMDVDSLYQYRDDPSDDLSGGHSRHVSLTEVPLLELPRRRGEDGEVKGGSGRE